MRDSHLSFTCNSSQGLAYAHGHFSSYEPELFPGLIYRMASPKIVLLIFVSGKIVLTGAKERVQIYQAFENIYPVLQVFQKQTDAAGTSTAGTSAAAALPSTGAAAAASDTTPALPAPAR